MGASCAEEEYVRYLHAERRCFAWVMEQHGGLAPAEAEAAALAHYPYEANESQFRGLIFHDEAWHWAMVEIHGQTYTIDHPEMATPSPEYRALD